MAFQGMSRQALKELMTIDQGMSQTNYILTEIRKTRRKAATRGNGVRARAERQRAGTSYLRQFTHDYGGRLAGEIRLFHC